jgi:phenylpyruvate tautomerase PptA (4-oxalocrotonate tautomerase family)
MPKLDVTIPADALTPEARRELPETLGATLLRWEGAPDTDFFRSITWAHLHELPAEAIRTPDGQAEPHAVVDISVPQGALSDRRKAGLVEDATKDILEATGWGEEAALRVWVLINEVPEGNWGAGKQIVRFEQLREAAKAEREKEDAVQAGSAKAPA